MNEEQLEKISAIIQALGNIEVRGKVNLFNLGGCISMLEDIRQQCAGDVKKQGSNEKE